MDLCDGGKVDDVGVAAARSWGTEAAVAPSWNVHVAWEKSPNVAGLKHT